MDRPILVDMLLRRLLLEDMLGLPRVGHRSFDELDSGCFVSGRKPRGAKSNGYLEFGGNSLLSVLLGRLKSNQWQ